MYPDMYPIIDLHFVSSCDVPEGRCPYSSSTYTKSVCYIIVVKIFMFIWATNACPEQHAGLSQVTLRHGANYNTLAIRNFGSNPW